MSISSDFDAVVIGGGHAGAEAARIIARGGRRVALVTIIADAIGRMSCNPAIGGLAKGHLVKEIDALGGLMAEATDASGIQFKVLNRSKGPAVQGPRAQCDRDLYAAAVQTLLRKEPNLAILEASVASIDKAGGRVVSVTLADGRRLRTRAVIVTTGTFLRALMHSGESRTVGGRFGEPSSDTLSESLRSFGLRLGRLKTGTPPRILRDSVDYEKLTPQPGDDEPRPFSILTDGLALPQLLCWLTYTNETSHELIRKNLHRAPMYTGQIAATGPRYCPSIEDKVVRFSEKDRHQIFVEPEGIDNPWLYLNGISTSLPADVQDDLIHSVPGLERAAVARYGYAVEYDFVNPEQLDATLQVRGLEGLYLAGQINGTSGYEEAAAQGLVAGINALQQLGGRDPFILRRDQAYIGVMVDDLITMGTEEPYRMFTSRAEYRLLLGCHSVYERLSPVAEKLGILDSERIRRVDDRMDRMSQVRRSIRAAALVPDRATTSWLEESNISLSAPTSIAGLLQRQDIGFHELLEACERRGSFPEMVSTVRQLREEELEAIVTEARYAGYIEKQAREAEKCRHDEDLRIPAGFSYERPGLSRELSDKLTLVQPVSIGQASRIRGMTPAAISILRMHVRARNRSSHGSHNGVADVFQPPAELERQS
ncbi:MAG: tRNA uridine-5-carboxymethylaminomethyl(34) synthesis enzyme MnmG [Acidobacteriota bacterium]